MLVQARVTCSVQRETPVYLDWDTIETKLNSIVCQLPRVSTKSRGDIRWGGMCFFYHEPEILLLISVMTFNTGTEFGTGSSGTGKRPLASSPLNSHFSLQKDWVSDAAA